MKNACKRTEVMAGRGMGAGALGQPSQGYGH